MIDVRDKRVLVVAAHPDDEVIGAGATLARLYIQGADVQVLLLGEGPTSRRTEVTGMAERIEAAHRELGVARPVIWPAFTDQKFDLQGQLTINHVVEDVVKAERPQVVLCHDGPTDLNLDHRMVHDAALVACRPSSGVEALLTFEVGCSGEWRFSQRFQPNLFVQVDAAALEAKIRALAAYGELAESPFPYSSMNIIAAARAWGAVGGVEFAEAFRLLRWTVTL